MGRLLDALNGVSELVSASSLYRDLRKPDHHLSLPYTAVGGVVGFAYRRYERRSLAGFFESPGRNLAVRTLWLVISIPTLVSLDEDDAGSISLGLALGSFAARLADRGE